MIVSTRFAPGDEVFHVQEVEARSCECGACLGRRTVASPTGLARCPICGGTGRRTGAGTVAHRVTGPFRIRALHARFEGNEWTVVYVMEHLGNTDLFFEADLHPTREAASRAAAFRTTSLVQTEVRA